MPHKYCRYCAHCISGDTYYCAGFEKVLHNIKSAVNCSKFVLSTLGDIDTGKPYKPRETVVVYDDDMQLTFEGGEENA